MNAHLVDTILESRFEFLSLTLGNVYFYIRHFYIILYYFLNSFFSPNMKPNRDVFTSEI